MPHQTLLINLEVAPDALTDVAFWGVVSVGQSAASLGFERDRNGRIVATLDNGICAVACPAFCGADVRYDTFRDKVLASTVDRGAWRAFRDVEYTRLRVALERAGFKPLRKYLIRTAVLMVAERRYADAKIRHA